MKPDDFEEQLRRQPLRAVPREWREKILQASMQSRAGILPVFRASSPTAEAQGQDARDGRLEACPTTSSLHSQRQSWWRQLLWPCPQAWVGVAAVWLVIFGLQLLAGSEPRMTSQLATAPPSPEFRAVLAEQRKLFAELLPPPESPPVVRRKEAADRPRSKSALQPGPPTAQWLELPPNQSFV